MPANDFGEVGRAVRARIASGLPPTPASAETMSKQREPLIAPDSQAFEAIRALNQAPPADEQLLALLR